MVENFTKWFLEKKQELNLTQKQIAEGVGRTQKMISLWENGTIPRPSSRKKIERFFGEEERKRKPIEADRSIINEVLLRNLLRQIAKIRSKLERRSLDDLEQEINEDNLEVLQDLEKKVYRKG